MTMPTTTDRRDDKARFVLAEASGRPSFVRTLSHWPALVRRKRALSSRRSVVVGMPVFLYLLLFTSTWYHSPILLSTICTYLE